MTRSLQLFILILFSSLHAQAIEAVVSHTVFYIPDTGKTATLRPYVELVWEIDPKSLHYVRSAKNTLSSMILTDIVFKNDTGIVREDRYTLQTAPKNTEKELLATNLMKLHRYGLPYGHFTISVKMQDITDTTNRFVYTDSITIAEPGYTPLYSDMQLLDTVYDAKSESVYSRNDKIQVPLPTNFLDNDHHFLRYYFELYKTLDVPKAEYPLVQHTFISQRENESAFPRFSRFDTIKAEKVVPTLGAFKITSLASGNYYVNTVLLNGLHRVVASKALFFQILNTNPEKLPEDTVIASVPDLENVTVLDLNKTFLSKYSYAQVRAILKMLIPVVDQNGYQTIKGFLKKPDDLYMRYFIYNYFSALNKKDPKAAWEAYTVKVREVNKLFGTSTMTGYETDRGIIYIRHGKPAQRLRIDNEIGTLPYELWVYDGSGQPGVNKKVDAGVFLFYRTSESISDYTLLHSTVPGEIKNPQWRNYLYTNSNNLISAPTKAEEYINNK